MTIRGDMFLRCNGCGAELFDPKTLHFSCPNAVLMPAVDHVLRQEGTAWPVQEEDEDDNPFIVYRHRLYSHFRALSASLSDQDYKDLVRKYDDSVNEVDGRSFRRTPVFFSKKLSDALSFSPGGGVWIKDETGNVSGSHKGRHLFGILLHLALAGRQDRPLAIASCGNAALAAAVIAAAAKKRLSVHIPPDANPLVVDRLRALGAVLVRCCRDTECRGDPCYLSFRAAVNSGEIPFTCQGPDNGLTIEGGKTLGYEIVQDWNGSFCEKDHVVVQAGGAALASSLAAAFEEALFHGRLNGIPRLHTVQTAGAFPLVRAYDRLAELCMIRFKGERMPEWKNAQDHLQPEERSERHGAGNLSNMLERSDFLRRNWSDSRIQATLRYAAHNRALFMWPWETTPGSIAGGILDDEAYDWFGVVSAMLQTGGVGIVVTEEGLRSANEKGTSLGGVAVCHTGSAGLAGLIALQGSGCVKPDEKGLVIFTGVDRSVEAARSHVEPQVRL